MAAPKKRYGTTRKKGRSELQKAEEVQESLEGLWRFIRKYRFLVGGGILLMFVGAVGYSMWDSSREDRLKSDSEAFAAVMDGFDATVGEGTAELPVDFKTDKDKYKSALTGLEAYAAAHEEAELIPLARLAMGPTHFALGDWDKDIEVVTAYLSANPDASLSPVLHQQLGLAAKGAGRFDDALASFQKMTEQGDWFFRASGHIRLGDLYHPVFVKAGGDRAKAREHYDAARTLLEEGEDKSLQRVIDTRIALLD